MQRKSYFLIAVLAASVLMISCGSGGKPDSQWQTYSYSLTAEDGGLLRYSVQLKITECYYISGESGDLELTVVYSAGNRGEEPVRFDWADLYIEDAAKHYYESDNGTESRELGSGQTQDELIVSYKLPANVAATGGMNKLHWGLYNADGNQLYYRIKLNPELHN